jgi:hypothetical protein
MGEVNMSKIIDDIQAFSSSMDVLLFFVLVSVSSLILAPTFIGNTQIMTLHSENAAWHNSQIMLSCVNGRTDDFYYAVAGTQMDMLLNETLGPGAVNSSVYLTGKKLVTGRELNHKTLADLSGESAASQFTIFHDNGSARLNLLTDEYKKNIDHQMQDYLDRQIGDRYNYNLTVLWRPIKGVPVGGETHIGPNVPDTAYVESIWITMPYHTECTRYYVEGLIQDELDAIGIVLSNASDENKFETKAVISGHINNAFNKTADYMVEEIVDILITKTVEKAQSSISQQIDYAVPGNNSGIGDKICQQIVKELKNDPSFVNNTIDIAGSELSDIITGYLQGIVKIEVHEIIGDKVDLLSTDITERYISGTAAVDDAKEQVLDYVFSYVYISKARMTLAIWDRNI